VPSSLHWDETFVCRARVRACACVRVCVRVRVGVGVGVWAWWEGPVAGASAVSEQRSDPS